MPAAAGIVLAINVDYATAYVRAVAAADGQRGAEHDRFLAFEDITDIRPVPATSHPGLATPAETLLELRTEAGPPYQFPVDPAWGVAPADFAEHVRAMVRDRRRPAGGTVILR